MNYEFYSFPNQKTVKINREFRGSDFLGINNDNWMAAARDLRAHAFLLYLYFSANADGYTFALSPKAIQEEIGMAPSTYRDQLRILIDKGYLVQTGGNTFSFYEKPRPQAVASNQDLNKRATPVSSDEECTENVCLNTNAVTTKAADSREINNIEILIDRLGINIDSPKAENTQQGSFVF